MTTNITCEQFDARLPDYMEGDLTGDERDAFERHAESCAHCRPILEELSAIVASAGTLGSIEPSRDLWSGIESRIGTRVVPLGTRRPTPFVRALAAAVVLMAVTAGVTWELATRGNDRGSRGPAPSAVASSSSDQSSPTGPGPVIVTTPPKVAINDALDDGATNAAPAGAATTTASAHLAPRSGSAAVTAVRNGAPAASTAALYDREITRLHSVIEQRRGELDPKTVAAIERSLAVIDTAIAQARSALAADPASRFLHGRLTDALDKKVELLRTTAMLPARS